MLKFNQSLRTFYIIALIFLCGLTAWWNIPQPLQRINFATSSSTPLANTSTTATRLAAGQMPLRFEENRGQFTDSVKFAARGNGYNLLFTPQETILNLQSDHQQATLRWQLLGSNPAATIAGQEPLNAKTHYLRGQQSWVTNVSNYSKITYQEVYPGIDLVYRGNQRQLEYDFVLAPQTTPDTIRLQLQGMQALHINAAGDLVLQVPGGEIIQPAPVIYQEVAGERVLVAGHYRQLNADTIGFAVEKYDSNLPLVIDPVVSYSTYFGGSDFDAANGVTVDSSGNTYLVGQTQSINFPVANALQPMLAMDSDGFIAKFNANGQLVFATYLGGAAADSVRSVALDTSNNIYVTGSTASMDFPQTMGALSTTLNGTQDAFVTKLSAAGDSIAYSTFLGGASDQDLAQAITVNSANQAYIVGQTASTDFPVTSTTRNSFTGPTTGFVTQLNADGTQLVYGGFFGPTGNTAINSIKLGPINEIYVAGTTDSADIPITANGLQLTLNGGKDAFFTVFDSNGDTVNYSTYLGGSGDDAATAISLSTTAEVAIAGNTASTNFNPISRLAFQTMNRGNGEGFVVKFAPTLLEGIQNKAPKNLQKLMPQQNQTKIPARQIIPSTGTEFNLIFGTYLGGTNADAITSIAFDTLGNVYVGGSTGSLNFPTFDPTLTPIQPIYGGGNSDGFLTQVHKNGQVLTFSSYLGGSGDDAVSASVADLSNNLYVAGRTTSGNFLVKNAAQSTLRMANDAFLTKVQPLRSGVATLSTTTLVFTGAVNTTSAPQIVRITNTGELPLTITNVALTTSDASQFSLMNGCPLGNLLLPQTSCELTVRFNPTIARLRQAAIVVETDVLETNQQFVTLLGDQLANQVTLNPTTLSFTAAVGNTDSKTLTLTNTGSEPLTINSIVLPSSDFTFTSDCLNGDAMLNGGESCTLNVTFRPTTAGRKDAVVSVSTSTGILTANLTGTQAAAGQLNLSPASLRFTTAVGTTSPAQRLTLTNTGSAPVCVRQITINSNDFIFTSNCIGSVNQSLTNGCLAVDESCTIDVSFRPTVAGSRNATLTITTDSGTATASLFGDNPNNGGGGDGGNGNGNGNNNLDIVELSQASYSVKEGEIFAVTVTRQGTGQQEIAVALVTNNTTTTNRDFSATSTIVTFEAGDFTPKTIMIDTVDDSEVEGTEFAEVQLGNPTNANLGLARANLIITDTEVAQPGRFQFSPTDIQVDEGARTATVTVTRSNGNNVPVTLNYLVSDGSAMAGSDYEQTAGTLTFSPGVNSQSFSVRIIDDGIIEGNETIAVGLIGVTNGGVIVNNRATITITDNDQPVNLGRLEADLNPVNFGGVNPGQSATSRVLLRNAGGQPVRIQSVATSGSGFNILGSFAPVTLMPNQTTPVMLTFRPTTTSGQANGMLLVDSDSNDLTISLQAQIIDTLAPSIIVISPNGGELLDAGRPTTIQFRAEDNGSLRNLVVGFMVNTATGVVQGDIARVDGNTQQVIWNIPPTLDSANARIVVTAVDRNGNQANGMSGLFSIRRAANNGLLQNTITFTVPPAGRVAPPSSLQVQSREIRDNAPASAPILEVAINFDPPPTGQIAPPQNVRVRAREFLSNSRNGNSTASSPNLINKFNNLGTRAVNPTDVVAYNIYRIPQRATGTPPTAEELIRPENLVATIDSGNTSFTDRVSTAQSNNYTYSITGFFGNGQMGGGSVPTGTNLPVIVNPSFEKGSIFVNVPNSFIQNGARMIVNDTETYSLQLNDSGTRFFTPKGGRSQGNNLTVKQLLPRGRSVKLIIRNPDGNTSTAVMFSRMARQAMVVNQQIAPREIGDFDLIGYNLYRVPQPLPGQPMPTPEQMIAPENLVGSVPGGTMVFTDLANPTLSSSGNFMYSITGFFGNGQMSGGSVPAGTNLPVVVNPTFEQRMLFINVPNSFIQNGARMIINDTESFPLELNESGTQFRVSRRAMSTPNGTTIDRAIPRGVTVRLTVRNPDGKESVSVMFRRN